MIKDPKTNPMSSSWILGNVKAANGALMKALRPTTTMYWIKWLQKLKL